MDLCLCFPGLVVGLNYSSVVNHFCGILNAYSKIMLCYVMLCYDNLELICQMMIDHIFLF